MIQERINHLKEGYSEVWVASFKYGVSKKTFNNGKSVKVFAEELRGKEFISFNYYITKTDRLLKPCEMPKEKVVHFLQSYQYKDD